MKFASDQSKKDKKKQSFYEDDNIARPPWMHIQDFFVLSDLYKLGPQTKAQLMSLGIKPFMVEKLMKYGIVSREYNPANNLYYYKVDTDALKGVNDTK